MVAVFLAFTKTLDINDLFTKEVIVDSKTTENCFIKFDGMGSVGQIVGFEFLITLKASKSDT